MLTLKFVIKNTLRHKLRTSLTVIGMTVAILAFSILRTMVSAWNHGIELSSAGRLVSRNAVSLGFCLPVSYKSRINRIKGVKLVSYANWFGGVYLDKRNFFVNFAIEPESYLKLYPEYILPPEQLSAFLHERRACIAGRKLAEKYGWKLGDTIVLQGTVFPGLWDFVLRGIYKGRDNHTNEQQFFFHWAYRFERLKKTAPHRADQAGIFLIGLDSPNMAAEVASEIDSTFKNSPAETITETEKAFQLNFVQMAEGAILLIEFVSLVVLLISLTVIANTMAMTVRERRGEYAVLKTIGFSGLYITTMILGESLFIALVGCAAGVALAYPTAGLLGGMLGAYFPVFSVTSKTIYTSLAASCLVGLLAPILPAYSVAKTQIAESLRKIG